MASPETISQILDAAGQVFAAKGFERATVREICAQAGVNLAAVNYHFGDKERLYVEAVKTARLVLEAVAPIPDDVETLKPEDALRGFIHALVKRILSSEGQTWRHELLVREFMKPSRACEEMMQESIRPTMDVLYAILRRLMGDQTPEHVIRQTGFSVISQCAYYRLQAEVVAMLTPEEEYETCFTHQALAEHITRFSIAAVRSYNSVDTYCETQESR